MGLSLGPLAGAAWAAGPATIALQLAPTSIVADGVSTTTATVTVLDSGMVGVSGETITFSSTPAGNGFGLVTDNGNGTYTATVTSSTVAGSPMITAMDSAASISAQRTLTQTPGPATTVTVKMTPTAIIADHSSTSTATATVKDAHGNLVASDNVMFASNPSGNGISGFMNRGDGTYTATITSTTTVGMPTITATDSTGPSGQATLNQTVGPAATVGVVLSSPSIVANGVTTSTATATVKDAEHRPIDNETIAFTSNDPSENVSSTTPVGGGTGKYTATITSSTTVGSPTITATDSTGPSGQATLNQTPGPAATVTVQLTPPVVLANGSSTSTATATVTDAEGHPLSNEPVVFSSSDLFDHVVLGPSANGTYTATITGSTTAGAPTITATDTSTNVSGHATLVHTANSSTTLLTKLPSTVATNQAVTLIATVTSSTSAASPMGSVAFDAGGTPITGCGNVAVQQSGQTAIVTCQASFAAPTSPEQLTAVFTPAIGSNVAGSTSAAVNLVISRDSTSTSLLLSASTLNVGTSATYTTVVVPAHTGAFVPSGAVEFLDGGAPIASCTAVRLAPYGQAATALCKVTYNQAGKHEITAHYGGDASFAGSTSSPAQQVTITKPTVPLRGAISSTMEWAFFYTPAYTRVLVLMVHAAPVGATILVTCGGRGCPFAKRTMLVAKPKPCRSTKKHRCAPHGSGTIDLMPGFRNHHLHIGATITVKLVRTHWIGKLYAFTMRAGRGPRIQLGCLAPGGTRPGVGC